ncbi:adenosylmethionine--8-amino-7-oxononanoate transaminase [Desulfonatronum sp. SC1]|uniref:adenosylmethionine--8-amino-7-oxononanoate transaminase n=1 Tax=Desulfonatronum sp. SC1 TaxID=2109626 RepID=UPI000D314FA1|nr:adenosylmethionine--8-amino-7-oxononanoate transaminase [Desulfonatronum sp. SC1]PTN36992.1 adenosylmethionine--8-amino-7-oxononanoate transaminase [Desulfonatronum sp. SC1]
MNNLADFDRRHIWHPYTSMTAPLPVYYADSAEGVRIRLADGRELIDGMASWWAAIHGYRHPALNAALTAQARRMSHVMFGGLAHQPAADVVERLLALVPEALDCVFLSDAGSVAVEVAMKMAIQYATGTGQPHRRRFLTLRGGYHGDTLHAMSVSDPHNGMHTLFSSALPAQFFAERPPAGFDAPTDEHYIGKLAALLDRHERDIAAVILEPIVQGAGGMHFYAPAYLRFLREQTARRGILLILDEIATGFGRTGRMFAHEHAGIVPDILCVGKALTGGMMTLGATLATRPVAEGISTSADLPFMHGPTFMGNPLACAVAAASLDLLCASPWQTRVERIGKAFREGLEPCRSLPDVADVRVLGAIGVVEMREPVDVAAFQHEFVKRGVWIRPFGRLVYIMPPYCIEPSDLATLTRAIREVVALNPTA